MRRVVAVLATVVSVVAAVVVAGALGRTSHDAAQRQAAPGGIVPALPGSVDIVRYQKFGGSKHCDSDSCGIGLSPQALHFTLPSAATMYRSTLTVSFRYRASGKEARFAVAPHVGPGVDVQPYGRRLLGTNNQLSTATFVVRPDLLAGGVQYGLRVEPDITHKLVKAGITVTQVVYSLHAWYTGPN